MSLSVVNSIAHILPLSDFCVCTVGATGISLPLQEAEGVILRKVVHDSHFPQ